MTKKQIVSEILDLSKQLDNNNDHKSSAMLIKVADKIAQDLVEEEQLEGVRRGSPVVPQNEQLKDLRLDKELDTPEVRLEGKRSKK